ncbi:pleckstrin homology domain-containing family H member 1-like isoform X2 [Amphiura filiformis]|uniref:pleckstrin homology domain-containing family H member 1-like isoform X2 n=1 Tax=Amphiura filiformis TaxID=82378 RepID=UPI003B21FDF5
MSTSSDGIDWPSAASDSEEGPSLIPPVPPSSAASSLASSSGAASLQLKRRPGSRSSGSGTDMASDDTSDDIEWKEKYLALEAQLEKFRIQAAKIRVVLGERMQELEHRVQESTERAEKAEKQVKDFQTTISKKQEDDDEEDENKNSSNKRVQALEAACQEKEDIIMHLEKQLNEQQTLRDQESTLVEGKVAKIKDWVATTVAELEEENQRLRQANHEANHMVRTLQARIQGHPEPTPFAFDPSPPRPPSPASTSDRPESLQLEAPEIPVRPTSATIREHLLNIHNHNGDAAEHERSFPLRPKPPRRSRKSPDDSHVSALIQVHEGFIKLGDGNDSEGFQCAACLERMKVVKAMEDKDTGNMMTWPRRQAAKNKLKLTPKQSSCDNDLDNYSVEADGPCVFCNHQGEDLYTDDSLFTDRTPPDTLGSSEASLMSTSSGVYLDAPSPNDGPCIAPPPTPATPVNGTGTVLGMTNDPPIKKLTKSASQSSIEALEALAESVNATTEVLQSRKSLDVSLQGTSTTSESLLSDLQSEDIEDETDRMLEAHFEMDIQDGEDVFLNGSFGMKRRSIENDYAELDDNILPSRKEDENKHENNDENEDDPNYQTLPSPETKIIEFVEGDYDEPPEEDDFFSANEEEVEVKTKDGQLIAIRLSNAPPPPPPPLHKMPSWETRILTIADRGMRMSASLENLSSPTKSLPSPICQSWDGSDAGLLYKDMEVPVYTTLRGHAAQIRSTPFSGDSSDSSDDEHSSGKGSSSACSTPDRLPMSPARKKGSKHSSTSSPSRKGIASFTSSTAGLKRGVSSHSAASDADYAIPPDAVSNAESNHSDEPEPKLLKTCAAFTAENIKKETMEKSGWLTKLGGRVKSWKRRWFVLKNGELRYYKSQNDTNRKPRGQVPLDSMCKILRSEGSLTFELVTAKRTYYLTAESSILMEEWIKVLQNVLRHHCSISAVEPSETKPSIEGWLTKVKHGHSKSCWGALVNRTFHYYKAKEDKHPIGSINMKDVMVEEVDQSQDSDDEDTHPSSNKFTLALTVSKLQSGPTYLIFTTKEDKDTWLYHLLVASGGGSADTGTEYERLIAKLMEVEGDTGSPFWKHAQLCYSKESIDRPLTTLPSEPLKKEAVKLNKSCNLFITVQMEAMAIDYHVSLAQNALQTCLSHPELQNEMYCQLIKQTTRIPQGPSASSSLQANPPDFTFNQAWQLMSLCCSLFLPRQKYMWYLRMHLQRYADPKTDFGKYAIFCQRSLDRTVMNGGRDAKPSRLEVLSILQRHPYHHSLPISIPVHFMNNTYEVVGFDGSTMVSELLQTLNRQVGMRDCEESGFALFTDDPAGRDVEHCLQNSVKICDVISKWEQTVKETQTGKVETAKMVRLTYKNRLFFRNMVKKETERERLLIVHQVNRDITRGRFPINRELALELAVLMAQLEFGDYKSGSGSDGSLNALALSTNIDTVIERFYPKRYRVTDEEELKDLKQLLADKWTALRNRNQLECVRLYLTVTRKWPFFGAKLFSAKCKFGKQEQVWLAVQDTGVSVLEYMSLHVVSTYSYQLIVTFGGCKEDFMLVLSQSVLKQPQREREHGTEKLLFIMEKPKILEITLLIASYINTIVKQRGLTYKPQGSGEMGAKETLTRKNSAPKVWDLESSSQPVLLSCAPKSSQIL